MASDWIDASVSTIDADYPVHAGVLIDLGRANLERAYEQSAISLGCYHHSTLMYSHAISATSTWEDATDEFDAIYIPARRTDSGGWRSITIGLEGRCATSSAKATVRIYGLPHFRRDTTPHSTLGVRGEYGYAELAIEGSSWTWDTGEISVTDSMVGLADVPYLASTEYSEVRTEETVLQAIVKCDEAVVVYLRSPHIRESGL